MKEKDIIKDNGKKIVEGDKSNNVKQHPNKNHKKFKLPFIVTLIGYFPMFVGIVLQCQQNEYLKKQLVDAQKQYREQLLPEIDCGYTYYGMADSASLSVKNIGLIDIKNVWMEEFVYIVDSTNVYLGTDVPHYNYAIYEGSRERIFDLDKGKSKEIILAEWQRYAFNKLVNKFHANIIAKWQITFSCYYSPKRYSFTKFFIYDSESLMFKEITQYVGGKTILDRIETYHSFGPKSEIRLFPVTHDFEVNPPDVFIINKDYVIEPLHIWRKVKLSEMIDAEYVQFCGGLNFMPSYDICEGTVRYIWDKSNGYITKSLLTVGSTKTYTPWVAGPLVYLNEKDAQTLTDNPDLLKTELSVHITKKREELLSKSIRDDHIEEIFRRAREKLYSENQ